MLCFIPIQVRSTLTFVDHCARGIAYSDRIVSLFFCSIRIHQCSINYVCKCKRKSYSVAASTTCASARENLTNTSPTILYPIPPQPIIGVAQIVRDT